MHQIKCLLKYWIGEYSVQYGKWKCTEVKKYYIKCVVGDSSVKFIKWKFMNGINMGYKVHTSNKYIAIGFKLFHCFIYCNSLRFDFTIRVFKWFLNILSYILNNIHFWNTLNLLKLFKRCIYYFLMYSVSMLFNLTNYFSRNCLLSTWLVRVSNCPRVSTSWITMPLQVIHKINPTSVLQPVFITSSVTQIFMVVHWQLFILNKALPS